MGGVETLLKILLQTAVHYALYTRRRARRKLRDGLRILVQYRGHGFRRRRLAECLLARHHLVKDRAEGKNVRTMVGRLSPHLFRRHVTHRPHHHAGFGCLQRDGLFILRCGVNERKLGQAEVENLDSSISREEQILRFQVAMNDAFVVRCCQAVGDLRSVINCGAQRDRPAVKTLTQHNDTDFGDSKIATLEPPPVRHRPRRYRE
jgi:hypothetical protein